MQLTFNINDADERTRVRRLLDVADAEARDDASTSTLIDQADDCDPHGAGAALSYIRNHVTSPAACRAAQAFVRRYIATGEYPVELHERKGRDLRLVATDGRRPETLGYLFKSGRIAFRLAPERAEDYSRADVVGSTFSLENGFGVEVNLVDEETVMQAQKLLSEAVDAD